jgi:hypothetical protein
VTDANPIAAPATPRTRLLAGTLAVVIAFAVCATTDASVALAKPLWLDEVVTQLIASAPEGVIAAMRSGADFQPPPYYSLVRFADFITGTNTAAMARMPSVIAAVLTIALVGATLRARLSLAASLAGALVLAAHPLFIAQATEARPYALWILATALTAESLRDRAGRGWFMALAAIAMCTAHYFGVLTLAAVGLAFIAYRSLAKRESWATAVRAALPLAVGGLALAALLPLAKDQLAATAGESWASPPTAHEIADFLRFIWGWRPVLYLLGGAVVIALARRIPALTPRLSIADRATLDAPIVAMFATAAVPVFVVLVSVLYKPTMSLRYSAPALLAAATICAIAVHSMPRWMRWVAVLFVVRSALLTDRSLGRASQAMIASFNVEQATLGRLGKQGIPVASFTRHDSYRASFANGRAHDVAWFDAPDAEYERAVQATQGVLTMPVLRVERGFGIAVRKQFAFPSALTLAELRAQPAVALLRDAEAAGADTVWLPGRARCEITPRIVVYSTSPLPACDSLRVR